MKKILALLFFPLLLAACVSDPVPVDKLQVDTKPKIGLDVLTVVVLDRTSPIGAASSNNRNEFKPTIGGALRDWATEKFVAAGSTGEAIIIIRDADLKTEQIPHKDSMFSREQASKYVGHANIEIDISGRAGKGRAIAEAARFETLPEDPSSNERQAAYMRLLNGLTRDISVKLRAGVNDHLSGFLAPSSGL